MPDTEDDMKPSEPDVRQAKVDLAKVPPVQGSLPNSWAVLVDCAKSILTLATALLGVTVTFADKLLPENPSPFQRWTLVSSWVLLVITIVAGVLCIMFSTNYLRNNAREKHSVACANIAFFALLFASIGFLLVGAGRVLTKEPVSIEAAIGTALDLQSRVSSAGQSWVIQELKWNPSSKSYEIMIYETPSKNTYTIHVSGEVPHITRFSKP